MNKKFKRITALTLVLLFFSSQVGFAANPRTLIAKAKASFDSPDTRRGGYVTLQNLQNSQAKQEAIIDQKNKLIDLLKIGRKDGSQMKVISEITPVAQPGQEELVTGHVVPLPVPNVPLPNIPMPNANLPTGEAVVDSTNDTHFALQWGIDAINAEEAWAFNQGDGIVAAIIDTGLDFLHPDIQSNIWLNTDEVAGNGIDDDGNGRIDDYRGWDFYYNDNNPTDDHGHGTHVAGIVAAAQNNSQGIAGVAPQSKIMALKVLDSFGGGIISTVLSAINLAIRYAADQGADLINMSLGLSPSYFTATTLAAFQSAVQYARNLGTILVVSAGNDYGSIQKYPALFDEVMTVGALYKSSPGVYLKDSYSNYGGDLDFMAPGTNVLSLRAKNTNSAYAYPYPNGDYIYFSGTSMAAPHVVGAIALLLDQDPFQSFDDIYRRLRFSSEDLGTTGYDIYNGYGIIDAFEALSYDYYDTGVVKTHYLAVPDSEGVVRFDYDAYGQLIKKTLADGGEILYEYFEEDFFGESLGRLIKTTHADGSFTMFQYWYDSGQVRFESHYDSSGNLIDVTAYEEDGDVIVGNETTLTQSINAQAYTSVSGTVYTYLPDTLIMYGKRSVNYALNIGEDGDYSLKFSTAQVTSKSAPPGYLFNFNIKIDGVTVANVNLNASKTFVPSDFIDLGNLTQGAHTLTLQWTNDYNTSPYDANVGIKGIEVYEMGGSVEIPSLPPCDGISCFYDPSGRLSLEYFADGTNIEYEYFTGTTTKFIEYYSDPDQLGGFPYKLIYYYESGNESSVYFSETDSGYDRYDENFYGDGKGRSYREFDIANGTMLYFQEYWQDTDIPKVTKVYDEFSPDLSIPWLYTLEYDSEGKIIRRMTADGSYTTYEEYFSSEVARFQKDYDAGGNLLVAREYGSDGNLIVTTYPSPPGDPVLVTTLNAQNYTSVSGTVYKYSPDILVFYGKRSANYALNIGEGGDYSLKFSTAQVTSKSAPPGYLFNFNIKIDSVTVANVNLNSSKTFTPSDFIDLGNLTAGAHTLTLQWTNDYNTSPYDANVGFKDIQLYEIPAEPAASFVFEDLATITDPTPNGGGYFGGQSISTNGVLILSDDNAGASRVFQVFDAKPGSATFGQLIGSISSPLATGVFGNTTILSGNVLLISNVATNGNIIFHAYDIDLNSPGFLNPILTIEDPTPDGFFGNDFRYFSPHKKLYIINKNLSGQEVYNIFDINPDSATFGQLLGSIELPAQNGGAFNIIAVFDVSAVYSPGVFYLRGVDSSGITRMYLYDVNPASATFEDLILTISDPDPVSPAKFGASHTFYNNYLIMSDENSFGDTFYHVFDTNRSSPMFGSSIKKIINPDLVAGDDFGSFFRVINDLFIVGDTDGSGNGLLHVFDFNPANLTFGDLIGTFDFPLAPANGFLFVGGRDDKLFVSPVNFNGSNYGASKSDIFDLNPQSPTFGQILATLEDPTPLTTSMNWFPFLYSFENTALFSENANGTFYMYSFNVDPDSPAFGQLISLLQLPNPSGGYGFSISEDGLVVQFTNSSTSTISLYHVSVG